MARWRVSVRPRLRCLTLPGTEFLVLNEREYQLQVRDLSRAVLAPGKKGNRRLGAARLVLTSDPLNRSIITGVTENKLRLLKWLHRWVIGAKVSVHFYREWRHTVACDPETLVP